MDCLGVHFRSSSWQRHHDDDAVGSLCCASRRNQEPGPPDTGVRRVERVRLADSGGENHLKMQLKSALYLGERWEYVLQLGELRLRVWGEEARAPGECWVAIPQDEFWVF